MSLSLGCLGNLPIAYLIPYSLEVPSSVDTYVIGLWDKKEEAWVDGKTQTYRNPILTDDGSSIYITSRAQVRYIAKFMEEASKNQDPELEVGAGMYNSKDGSGLFGGFNPAGIDDVLQYLTCVR